VKQKRRKKKDKTKKVHKKNKTKIGLDRKD
jgi:hypothetical protein